MLKENNRHSIDQLIDYYQALNNLNGKFSSINTNNTRGANCKSLIEQLIAIRELLINKTFDDINAIYRPTAGLFICKDHYAILEDTINFYKTNINESYPIPTAKEPELIGDNSGINGNNGTEFASLCSEIKEHLADTSNKISQSYNNIETRLSTTLDEKLNVFTTQPNASNNSEAENGTNTEILNKVSQIHESIGNILNNDLNKSLIKSSQEALVAIKATYDNTKSDISRYDKLLTEHINQSNVNIAEAMAKEHDRFVHKISSDVNVIVDGITKANNAEFETNLQKLEDKSLKWFFFAFIMNSVLMFMCSMFSSVWAANKAINNAKVFKLSVDCAATTTAKKIKSLQIVK